MKKVFYALFALTLSFTPVNASTNETMLDMIDWITENSKYEYNGEKLPWLEIRTQEEICETVYEEVPENCIAVAYYDHNMNAIFVSPDPIGKMVQEKFIEVMLFHELVHYLQYLNGEDKRVACSNELEMNAYKLQDKYIQHMGWPEEQRPNMLFAYLVSSCHPHN